MASIPHTETVAPDAETSTPGEQKPFAERTDRAKYLQIQWRVRKRITVQGFADRCEIAKSTAHKLLTHPDGPPTEKLQLLPEPLRSELLGKR